MKITDPQKMLKLLGKGELNPNLEFDVENLGKATQKVILDTKNIFRRHYNFGLDFHYLYKKLGSIKSPFTWYVERKLKKLQIISAGLNLLITTSYKDIPEKEKAMVKQNLLNLKAELLELAAECTGVITDSYKDAHSLAKKLAEKGILTNDEVKLFDPTKINIPKAVALLNSKNIKGSANQKIVEELGKKLTSIRDIKEAQAEIRGNLQNAIDLVSGKKVRFVEKEYNYIKTPQTTFEALGMLFSSLNPFSEENKNQRLLEQIEAKLQNPKVKRNPEYLKKLAEAKIRLLNIITQNKLETSDSREYVCDLVNNIQKLKGIQPIFTDPQITSLQTLASPKDALKLVEEKIKSVKILREFDTRIERATKSVKEAQNVLKTVDTDKSKAAENLKNAKEALEEAKEFKAIATKELTRAKKTLTTLKQVIQSIPKIHTDVQNNQAELFEEIDDILNDVDFDPLNGENRQGFLSKMKNDLKFRNFVAGLTYVGGIPAINVTARALGFTPLILRTGVASFGYLPSMVQDALIFGAIVNSDVIVKSTGKIAKFTFNKVMHPRKTLNRLWKLIV